MKTRLNLTIDDTLLTSMKQYASKEQTSVSELVENYFSMLTKRKKKKNIIDLIESLDAPTKIATNADLKDLFYKDQAKKHGF
jgi:UDP-2,3-diacylglucosamine pyrophosphatase LpxH